MTSKQRRALDFGLFIFGCVGVVATAVMSGRDTLKADKIIKEKDIALTSKEYAESVETHDSIICTTKPEYAKEVIKNTWKCYIPTAITMALTLSAFIVSKRLTTKEIAALSTALAGAGSMAARYRNEIKERLGEDALSEIDKKVSKEVKADREDDTIDIYDTFTGQTFTTTKMAFVTAKYLINQHFALGSEVPLKMFYNMQGVDIPDEYERYGWSWEDFNDGYIWIEVNLVNKGDHYEMSFDYDPFDMGGVTCG